MKKWLVIILLVLIGASLFGQWLLNDPGYLLITRGHWQLQASLGFMLLVLLVLWVASVVILGLLVWFWQRLAPAHFSRRLRGYLAQKRLSRGVKALGEGRWSRAEKLFAAASDSSWPYPGQLAAAYAAQQQGRTEARNTYLAAAEQDKRGEKLAHWLRLYWHALEGKPSVAAEVDELLAHSPQNFPLRELAINLAEKEQRWTDVWQHLEQLPTDIPVQKQRRLWRGLLKQQAEAEKPRKDRATKLHKLWKKAPAALRQEPSLVVQYAGYLAQLGEPEKVLPLLSSAVEQGWDDRYATLLGDINTLDAASLLKQLESWLKRYPDKSGLALLAGRTAMRANLWGKAEEFFRTAGHQGSVQAWAELARLKQAQGDEAAVQACLTEQSQRVSGHLPPLPLPHQ